MFRTDTSKPKSFLNELRWLRCRDLLKIAGCVTSARRPASFRSFHAGCKRKRAKRGGPSTSRRRPLHSAPASRHEDSKKVRRGRLNSRRELRCASRSSPRRFVPWRQIGERIDRAPSPQRRRRNNISPGAVARRENRSCRDGESVRNGAARPGPAYPAGGSKRKEAERRSADSRGALSDGTIDIVVEGDNSGRWRRRRELHSVHR